MSLHLHWKDTNFFLFLNFLVKEVFKVADGFCGSSSSGVTVLLALPLPLQSQLVVWRAESARGYQVKSSTLCLTNVAAQHVVWSIKEVLGTSHLRCGCSV